MSSLTSTLCSLEQNTSQISHCWRCHYAAVRHELNIEIEDSMRYAETLAKDWSHSPWLKTAEVIWACFCLQWPLIGWAMIMGKE